MKLRTKLLLGVGLLLFLMVIIMYIVPSFFIRKDVYKAAGEIHALLVEDHQQLVNSQQIWLENTLVFVKQNNDSLLLMLNEMPQLILSKNLWSSLAQAVGFDPTIGFMQVHTPKETAVIIPHAAHLYSVENTSETFHLTLLDKKFMGVPLPLENVEEKFFILFDPQEEKSKAEKEVDALAPELAKYKEQKTSSLWEMKVEMIRMLAPFFAQGLSSSGPIARGIVHLNELGHGYALLADEVFATQPLFDDAAYYNAHRPSSGSAPLAEGAVIVTLEGKEDAFIGNTLFLEKSYITVSTPLSLLAQQLALSSNKMILLRVNTDFWMGFDGLGHKIPQQKVEALVEAGLADQEKGLVDWDGKQFFFARLGALQDDALKFYDFHPVGGKSSILSTLLSLEEQLSNRISLQLFLIALVTMLLVLLFIGRMAFSVIYPITQLAHATKAVAAGKYEEVALPEVSGRNDEVAILTHSFGEMVKGLQEREKIRAVLDKVVSKDVADEILKSHIHLGGEDRVVSMLFGDIRGFTQLTSASSPQETIGMLNACMTKVSRVIEGEGGVIDKYVGDEVMAIFGAPAPHPDHALRAISSGMLIIENLKKWNRERLNRGEPPIEMGMGIHTGLVVAGNMGAEDRLNYTVLGSTVNLTD